MLDAHRFMPTTRSKPKSQEHKRPGVKSRRGSPDVVRKRRAARHFNELLAEVGAGALKLDGRTEKRRARMLDELREGQVRSTKRPLKPIDILVRVQALLDLGEPIASIKKAARPSRAVPLSPEVIDGLKRLHAAYEFRLEVYAFVGFDGAALTKAKIRPSARAGSAGAAA